MKKLYWLIGHAFLSGVFLTLTAAAVGHSWHSIAIVGGACLCGFNVYSTWYYARGIIHQTRMLLGVDEPGN